MPCRTAKYIKEAGVYKSILDSIDKAKDSPSASQQTKLLNGLGNSFSDGAVLVTDGIQHSVDIPKTTEFSWSKFNPFQRKLSGQDYYPLTPRVW